jgi:uncharacterized protein YbjT (DUF2867 family)
MTVLVSGATGTIGSAVVTELVARGVAVRATTRSRHNLPGLARPGVEPVVLDHTNTASLLAALRGVAAAYLAVPTAPDMAATEGAFARAAADAGVPVVVLSTLGAAPDSPLRFGRAHAAAEAAVEAAGGAWTFLAPHGFMQNDLAWAAQVPGGTIAGPVMDAAWSIVDARDVAAVAAAVLTDPPPYAGRRLALTGPEARTPRDRVRALAEILGRELAVVDAPVAAVAEQLRGLGVPQWQVGRARRAVRGVRPRARHRGRARRHRGPGSPGPHLGRVRGRPRRGPRRMTPGATAAPSAARRPSGSSRR